MGAESKVFSYSDVSAHNSSEDCWVIINGKVYNVTNYLNEHPGGDEVLLEQAGKDASEEFEDVGHGSAARLMLDEYYVGEVDPNSKMQKPINNDVDSTSINNKDNTSLETNNNVKLILFVLLALAIMGFGVVIPLVSFSS